MILSFCSNYDLPTESLAIALISLIVYCLTFKPNLLTRLSMMGPSDSLILVLLFLFAIVNSSTPRMSDWTKSTNCSRELILDVYSKRQASPCRIEQTVEIFSDFDTNIFLRESQFNGVNLSFYLLRSSINFLPANISSVVSSWLFY